jgi:hypothetical protein
MHADVWPKILGRVTPWETGIRWEDNIKTDLKEKHIRIWS